MISTGSGLRISLRLGAKIMNNMMFRKKIPDDEGQFKTYNNTRFPAIKPRKIINELKKSEVGREALAYLEKHNVPVYLCSGVDSENWMCGFYDKFEDTITIYCDKLDGKKEIAKTVIHEAMHRRLGAKGTFEEEVKCYSQEHFHDHNELTDSDRQAIIKMVEALYKNRGLL